MVTGVAMIGFWVSAGAMALMVLVVLAQALRRGADAGPGAEDRAIYRDQLAEVERDVTRGLLGSEEAGRIRAEIGRRLLDSAPLAASGRTLPLWVGAFGLGVALAGALAAYLALGVPGYGDQPLTLRLAEAETAYAARPSQAVAEQARGPWVAPEGTDPQTLQLMEQLRSAVAGRPEDLQGHVLLAENEAKLGNFAAARVAQEAVLRLKGAGATAEDHLRAAELMIYAAGGVVTAEAEAELGAVLTMDPKDGAARFWMGLMAAQVGRPDRAFQMWAPLLEEGPQDAPWIEPIASQIEAIAAAAGVPYEKPQAGPGAEDVAAAAAMTPEARAEMIQGMVGGLEERLLAEGGPVEDWLKLIRALGVLGDKPRMASALAAARKAYAAEPGALSALTAAAKEGGLE